eukprot:CAMPEP_0175031520 /NCGR_PEP_ID=MMETSP0005-20121125/20861_1 /TAXON_ID=420556 /ORGANISM="Ochromonas sp., Strain CCMP1393" /LENGTH=203 /DNA_ID=CAMNT_0016291779 /DNA_START=54 /DNA_END=662 /DNA_ORIENTATION=-
MYRRYHPVSLYVHGCVFVLYTATLLQLEHKIVIVSSDRFTASVLLGEWLQQCLSPFLKWCYIYAPVAPLSLARHLIQCPTPYILGIQRQHYFRAPKKEKKKHKKVKTRTTAVAGTRHPQQETQQDEQREDDDNGDDDGDDDTRDAPLETEVPLDALVVDLDRAAVLQLPSIPRAGGGGLRQCMPVIRALSDSMAAVLQPRFTH